MALLHGRVWRLTAQNGGFRPGQMHRGIANQWTGPRPISLLSFVRTFWRDGVNFKTQQSKAWDSLPSQHMKKVLTRIDGANYVSSCPGPPGVVKRPQRFP